MKIHIKQGDESAELEIKKAKYYNADKRLIEVVYPDKSKGVFAAKDVANLKELSLK